MLRKNSFTLSSFRLLKLKVDIGSTPELFDTMPLSQKIKGEAVVACDTLEPCKFPSHDSGRKKFPRTHKEVDLAAHPVVCLLFQVGDAEKFPQAFGFEGLNPFFFLESANRVHVSQP